MAKFILGATERVKRDDSIPVELLPSNKILYAAKLNNDEETDVTPTKCNNLKEVFEKFRPGFSVEMESSPMLMILSTQRKGGRCGILVYISSIRSVIQTDFNWIDPV